MILAFAVAFGRSVVAIGAAWRPAGSAWVWPAWCGCDQARVPKPTMAVDPAKVPLCILIPAKNEAGNLPRCLASVRWADEIWVVDSQSNDGTAAIAESRGARVAQF